MKKINDEKATNDQELLNENLYFMSLYVEIIYFDTCKHLIKKYTLTVIFNHELNMTIITFIYFLLFIYRWVKLEQKYRKITGSEKS